MRSRDIVILLVAGVGMFLSFSVEHDYALTLSWYMEIDTTHYHNGIFPEVHERLPTPLITDLDGDGKNEVVVVSHDAKIRIMAPSNATAKQKVGRKHEPFDLTQHITAEAKLYKVNIQSGRQPVAMASGYLSDTKQQVVVVLTAEWTVLCFDHTLKLLWETNPSEHRSAGTVHREAAIMIAPVNLRSEDHGVIVVGSALELLEHNIHFRGKKGAKMTGDSHKAPRPPQAATEQPPPKPKISVPGSRRLLQDSMPPTDGAAATSEQGTTQPPNIAAPKFEIDPAITAQGGTRPPEEMTHQDEEAPFTGHESDYAPDPNFVPDEQLSETERAMKETLEAIFEAEDHGLSFDQELHHFNYFAFEGKTGAVRWSHKARDFHEELRDHQVVVPQHSYKLDLMKEVKHEGEKDWRHYRESMLEALPHVWQHRDDTALKLAHFSKRSRRSHDSKTKAEHDAKHLSNELGLDVHPSAHAKDKNFLDYHGVNTAPSVGGKPNVIVAHLTHGIEAVHLYSGRTLCQITLPMGVYADINGDGAIDRASAVVGHAGQMHREGHTFEAEEGVHCSALMSTGIPPAHLLFNKSICAPETLRSVFENKDLDEHTLAATAPVILKRSHTRTAQERFGSDVVFFVSSGEVTSFGGYGQQNWQIQSEASWKRSVAIKDTHRVSPNKQQTWTLQMPMFPILATYVIDERLHENLLVVGASQMVAISQDGDVLAETEIPDPPVAPAAFGDFNNDKHTDVILAAHNAYYGYMWERRPGSKLFQWVVGSLLLSMLVVVVLQISAAEPEASALHGRPRGGFAAMQRKDKRSTD